MCICVCMCVYVYVMHLSLSLSFFFFLIHQTFFVLSVSMLLSLTSEISRELVFKARKTDHVSSLFNFMRLHWLPVSYRIQYKLSVLCYQVIRTIVPSYLSDLVQLYVPWRSHRFSANNRILRVPMTNKNYQGQRAFLFAGPVAWNSLPKDIRHTETVSKFKFHLKTCLFSRAFENSTWEPDLLLCCTKPM